MTGEASFDDMLRRQIVDIFGFGEDASPEDRELFEALEHLSRADEALREADRADMTRRLHTVAAYITDKYGPLLPDGMRFEFVAE